MEISLVHLELVLNTDKTKYRVFSRAKETDRNFQIYSLNGTLIEKIPHYKYLGIFIIDDKFIFKYHIDHLSEKLRMQLGFLDRNRSCFPFYCGKQIMEATFLSVLDYGDVIYRHAPISNLKYIDSAYH